MEAISLGRGSLNQELSACHLCESAKRTTFPAGESICATIIIVCRFEKQVRHYKLYFEDGYHYVGQCTHLPPLPLPPKHSDSSLSICTQGKSHLTLWKTWFKTD